VVPGEGLSRQAEAVDVAEGRVQPEVDEGQTFDDEIFLGRPSQAQRDVGFPAREVHVEVGALKLELDLGIALPESAEMGCDESSRQHLGGGQSDEALELLVLPGDLALDAERLALDALRAGQQAMAGLGQDVSSGGPVEEPGAELLLELHEPTAYGGGIQL
jgi:hypothetical protein